MSWLALWQHRQHIVQHNMRERKKLSIFIDWQIIYTDDKFINRHPSSYDPATNHIYVNPFYNHEHAFMFFRPLFHEVEHYLIERLFPTISKIGDQFYPKTFYITKPLVGERLHKLLDRIDSWLIYHTIKRRYSNYSIYKKYLEITDIQ